MPATAMNQVDRSIAALEQISLRSLLERYHLYCFASSQNLSDFAVKLPGVNVKGEPELVLQGNSMEAALQALCDRLSGNKVVIQGGNECKGRMTVQMPAKVTLR